MLSTFDEAEIVRLPGGRLLEVFGVYQYDNMVMTAIRLSHRNQAFPTVTQAVASTTQWTGKLSVKARSISTRCTEMPRQRLGTPLFPNPKSQVLPFRLLPLNSVSKCILSFRHISI